MAAAGAGERVAERGEKLKLAGWSVGVAAVFLFHVGALFVAAVGMDGGAEVWSILLLIFAPLAVVGIIGGGVARAVRSSRPSDPAHDEEETR